ncbi:MAG: hypothetical protein ACTSYH_05805 [Candidatus Heimdallarchaeaceae archaeon]
MDKGNDVWKKFKTKSMLELLDEVKKEKTKNESENNNLDELVHLNEVAFIHRFRNNAQHNGSITKEEQLLEIIPKAMIAMNAFLKVILNHKCDILSDYLSGLGIQKDPTQLYFEEANNAYYAGELFIAFQKKLSAIKSTIRDLSKWLNVYETRKIRRYKEDYPRDIPDYPKLIMKLIETEPFKKKYPDEDLSHMKKDYILASNLSRRLKGIVNIDQEEVLSHWSKLNTIESKIIDVYLYVKPKFESDSKKKDAPE